MHLTFCQYLVLQSEHLVWQCFLLTHLSPPQTEEWRCRAQHFDQMCKAVVQMFNRLSNAPNRRILYDLYNYICDIKSGVGLACAHVKALGEGSCVPAPRQGNSQTP